MNTLIWQIAGLAVLLILSGFFSASETALFSLSKIQLHRIKENSPRAYAVITHLLDSPARTLNTILTGNMLVNVASSALVTDAAMQIAGSRALAASCGLTTFLLLVFGEVTPKTVAISFAEGLSCLIARPLYLFAKIIFPVRFVWSQLANFFTRRLIGKRYYKGHFLTEEEIRGLLSIGEKEGVVSAEEEQMISTVFDFGERYVNEIMTPRVDIVAADVNQDNLTLERILKTSRYTRLPVFKDSIDNVIGVLYAKEYLLSPQAEWQGLVKPVLFVPETKRIEELLLEFLSKSSSLAIVTDEYGGTSGMVSIEDILEEIVGEIQDEYDSEEKLIVRVDGNTVTASGKTSLYDLNDELHTNFKAKDAQTVSGLIIHLFGRIPKTGESIRYRKYFFTADDVRKHRVRKVTIKKD